MSGPDDLLRRIRRLEDRAEIGELVAPRPDAASGNVLAHVEMNRKDRPMLAAIRYADR